MKHSELKEFLEEKVKKFNRPEFIAYDPIQVPKQFSGNENIEISAFFTATISWGNRQAIIKSAQRLMTLMDNNPYDFILNATSNDYNHLKNYVHRTFNGHDCIHFIRALKNLYENHGGLQNVFETGYKKKGTIKEALIHFYSLFYDTPGERTRKHIANVKKGASAKRLNMFLRWMVRNDESNVDFGLWKKIPASSLMLPLDIHSGRIARLLGLLKRNQNDWKAVEEVTGILSKFDPADPVKYDFALFGLGAFEDFQNGKKQLFSI